MAGRGSGWERRERGAVEEEEGKEFGHRRSQGARQGLRWAQEWGETVPDEEGKPKLTAPTQPSSPSSNSPPPLPSPQFPSPRLPAPLFPLPQQHLYHHCYNPPLPPLPNPPLPNSPLFGLVWAGIYNPAPLLPCPLPAPRRPTTSTYLSCGAACSTCTAGTPCRGGRRTCTVRGGALGVGWEGGREGGVACMIG